MKIALFIMGIAVACLGYAAFDAVREAEDLRYAKMSFQRDILRKEIELLRRSVSMSEQTSGPVIRWIGGSGMTPDSVAKLISKDPNGAHAKITASLMRAVLMRHIVAGEPLEAARTPVSDRCSLLGEFTRKYALEASAEVQSLIGPFDKALRELDGILSVQALRDLSSRLASEIREPEVPVLATSSPVPAI